MDLIPVTTGTDEPQQRRALEMARKGDLERQARVVTDTNKLFKLAEELKDSVSKSNVNILSIEVLQKANEIEKLAHSVKEKMRGPN
jgi:spore coat polysaccharide biosynthesis protein SpsF (cytidylyltransferase family)